MQSHPWSTVPAESLDPQLKNSHHLTLCPIVLNFFPGFLCVCRWYMPSFFFLDQKTWLEFCTEVCCIFCIFLSTIPTTHYHAFNMKARQKTIPHHWGKSTARGKGMQVKCETWIPVKNLMIQLNTSKGVGLKMEDNRCLWNLLELMPRRLQQVQERERGLRQY